jgi:hypothetical protein
MIPLLMRLRFPSIQFSSHGYVPTKSPAGVRTYYRCLVSSPPCMAPALLLWHDGAIAKKGGACCGQQEQRPSGFGRSWGRRRPAREEERRRPGQPGSARSALRTFLSSQQCVLGHLRAVLPACPGSGGEKGLRPRCRRDVSVARSIDRPSGVVASIDRAHRHRPSITSTVWVFLPMLLASE